MKPVPAALCGADGISQYRIPFAPSLLILLIPALWLGGTALAATRTWLGAAGGNWSAPGNWQPAGPPATGDLLAFPGVSATATTTMTNDLAGLSVSQLKFTGNGYVLDGQSLTVTYSMTSESTNAAPHLRLSLVLTGIAWEYAYVKNPAAVMTVDGDLSLEGTSIVFHGPGTYIFNGRIRGSGGFNATEQARIVLAGVGDNTFANMVLLDSASLWLNKSNGVAVPTNLLFYPNPAASNIVTLGSSGQIRSNATVTLYDKGLLNLNGHTNGIRDLTFVNGGEVVTGAGSLQLGGRLSVTTAGLNQPVRFSGRLDLGDQPHQFTVTAVEPVGFGPDLVISGTGDMTTTLNGTLLLEGTNTYRGLISTLRGRLLINAHQPGSDVRVYTSGNIPALGGSGTIGDLTMTAGILDPGVRTGILTCSNVALHPQTTFAVDLNGTTAGSGYDRLDVRGTVNLSNATLRVSMGFVPVVGDTFGIINNDGNDAVIGTFKGLTNNATLTNAWFDMQISYRSGSGAGNDVVLTVTRVTRPPAFSLLPPQVSGTNLLLSWTGGLPVYSIQRQTSLSSFWDWEEVLRVTNGTSATVRTNLVQGFYRVLQGN